MDNSAETAQAEDTAGASDPAKINTSTAGDAASIDLETQAVATVLRRKGQRDSGWSGAVASGLSRDNLSRLPAAFPLLPASVKVKVLLALVLLRQSDLQEHRSAVESVMHEATTDSDPWVSLVGNIVKDGPFEGKLHTTEDHALTRSCLAGIQGKGSGLLLQLSEQQDRQPGLALVANSSAKPTNDHFRLRRKPKPAPVPLFSMDRGPSYSRHRSSMKRLQANPTITLSASRPTSTTLTRPSIGRTPGSGAIASSSGSGNRSVGGSGLTKRQLLARQMQADATGGSETKVKTIGLEDMQKLQEAKRQKKGAVKRKQVDAKSGPPAKAAKTEEGADVTAQAKNQPSVEVRDETAAAVPSPQPQKSTVETQRDESSEEAAKALTAMASTIMANSKASVVKPEGRKGDVEDMLSTGNRVTDDIAGQIRAILDGDRSQEGQGKLRLVLHEETLETDGKQLLQQSVFEMDFPKNAFRVFRRRKAVGSK